MPAGSRPKRERQYEHIKESYEKRGQKGRAKEIAARTVNKERAEAGETKEQKQSGRKSSSSSKPSASKSSSSKPSARSSSKSSSSKSSSSSGKSSRASASSRGSDRTKSELYQEAKRRDISGRSQMNKAQLERALSK